MAKKNKKKAVKKNRKKTIITKANKKPAARSAAKTQGITPCFWFDEQIEEAVNFYVSVFKAMGRPASIGKVSYYGVEGAKASGQKEGSVLTIMFYLDGQEFMALNGGSVFKFNMAVSFTVNCETQNEVDGFWEKLSAGGCEVQCGWLTDKFGLSWQIVPTIFPKMLTDKDPKRSERAMKAMLQMKKLDIEKLKQAYNNPL